MSRAGEIIAFDVETTGLTPQRGHRVIEIGAVRIVNGAFAEEFHSLIDCGGSISMLAQRIHGITPAMLRGWSDCLQNSEVKGHPFRLFPA